MPGKKRLLGVLLALCTMSFRSAGGWIVTTVHQLPEYLEAGKSYTLIFSVRQHGHTLLSSLRPKLRIANSRQGGQLETAVEAEPLSQPGSYTATFAAPGVGPAYLTIQTGFGGSNYGDLALLPLPVTEKGETRKPLLPVDRGRQLFVAKGCATCHINGDIPEFAEWNRIVSVGPELTGRAFPGEYVRQKLADPASLRTAASSKGQEMPQLELDQSEIGAIAAYLGGVRVSSGEPAQVRQ